MTRSLTPAINPITLERTSPQPLKDQTHNALPERTDTFAGVLAAARSPQSAHQRGTSAARAHAEDLVAMTFIQPLLAQLRTDVFGGGAFSAGTVQNQLSPLADAAIARNMVRGANIPLVDAIERTITNAPANQAKPDQTGAVQ